MGREGAVAEARRLKEALLDNGVPEVSIEVMRGRPASGDEWNNQFVMSDFGHHTVSRYGSNKTPCLALVKRGRSDLPGPLCNAYGGWDLCARIITLGYANHPGFGGPMRVPSGVKSPPVYVIPRDNARKYAFGWEFEGGLNEADWGRTLSNPRGKGRNMTMHEFMARCLNGTQQMYDLPYRAHAEHSTWTSRKVDRLRYTKQRGIEVMKVHGRPVLPPRPTVDVSKAAQQFRIVLGVEEGKVRDSDDVRLLQRHLNAVYPSHKVQVDGKADQALAEKWERHEEAMGGKGRTKVPDVKSTQALAKKSGGKFRVVV